MKLVLFGATGGTGRAIAEQAIDAGHAVTAFTRSRAKLGELSGRLAVATGDVADRMAVEKACTGQEAALVALGAANPFRRIPSLTVGMHNILMALEAANATRLVYLSADTVDRRRLNFLRGRIIVPLFLAATAADHELDEAMIRQSRLAWVIVRPPMLTNGPRTGRYRAGEDVRSRTMLPRLSRRDVADFMLRQLTDDSFLRQAPTLLSSWRALQDSNLQPLA